MTNLEAFKIILDDPKIKEERIAQLLQVSGIEPVGEWSELQSNPIRCRLYDEVIKEGLKNRDIGKSVKSISEGGYSVSYADADPSIKNWALWMANNSGCSSLINKYSPNKIKDISHLLCR